MFSTVYDIPQPMTYHVLCDTQDLGHFSPGKKKRRFLVALIPFVRESFRLITKEGSCAIDSDNADFRLEHADAISLATRCLNAPVRMKEIPLPVSIDPSSCR